MPVLLAPIAIMYALIQELWNLTKKPKYRSLLIWMFLILLVGTVFYHRMEGWSWIDSLYFCVITLATVGYGDLNPSTDLSKIFTMFYIFASFSVFVSFASMLAKERMEIRQKRQEERQKNIKAKG